ncbi:MAG: 1-phosphofructokinase [Clostridia bacterium]|nr:1-phosphofructokinase [Clostridia bacterium]
MIYTLTLNPAVDYVMDIEHLREGEVNRSCRENIFFGGKGINVSMILAELKVPSCALGFIGGFTGRALEEGMRGAGIETDFTHLREGMTRINVKLRGNTITEINGAGPAISEGDMTSLYERLYLLCEGDTLVIAGSVPSSLPRNTYELIMERLSKKGIRFAVDASGELLTRSLKYRPFVIKPNIHELSEIAGKAFESVEEVAAFAGELQEMGAVNVLVSMGEMGALLADEFGNVHVQDAFKGRAVNTVGAGDSMLAGFLAGVGESYSHALLLGTAAGGATAFSEGLATREKIIELMSAQ